MADTDPDDIASRLRRMRLLALSCWICFACWGAVFYGFWRFGVTRPSGWFATLSLVSVALLAIWLALCCFNLFCSAVSWRIRIAIFGWLLIGTFPVGNFGARWLHGAMTFGDRRPESFFVTERVNVVWLSSLLDANARARLWVYRGKHITLCNHRQVAVPHVLLDAMDRHVIEMCRLLGADPPSDVAWMRASMMGFDRFSVGAWGVAGADEDAATATVLDRHEVAHAVISELAGRESDPPRFLAEGWAESQSADRAPLILALAGDTRRTRFLKLDDLLDQHWYRASREPVYSFGGPFVIYLLQRFEGPKFLSLYRGVRQHSFPDDVRRILGVSWSDLESDFWVWLASEAELIQQSADRLDGAANSRPPIKLEFANESDRIAWQRLTERYAQTIWANRQFPAHLNLKMKSDLVDSGGSDSIQRRLSVCIENGECFAHYDADSPLFSSSEFVLAKPGAYAIASRQDEEDWLLVNGIGQKAAAYQLIARYERMGCGADDLDPGQQIPIGAPLPPESRRFRLEKILEPSVNEGLWYVKMTDWIEATGAPLRSEYWLDETHDLALVKQTRSFEPEEMQSVTTVALPDHAGEFFPLAMTIHRIDGDSSFVCEVAIRQLDESEIQTLKRLVVSSTRNTKLIAESRWYDFLPPTTCGLLLLGIACAANLSLAKR